MSWLGCEGFQFVQTLMDGEQEICKSSVGLFSILNAKFEPQHKKLSYHYSIAK